MFDGISKRFDTIFRNLRGLGKITDQNIDHISREIRKALLEADVNFLVAKEFVNNVKISAQGTKVLKSIKPGEQFINIIHKEMIKTLILIFMILILNYFKVFIIYHMSIL